MYSVILIASIRKKAFQQSVLMQKHLKLIDQMPVEQTVQHSFKMIILQIVQVMILLILIILLLLP